MLDIPYWLSKAAEANKFLQAVRVHKIAAWLLQRRGGAVKHGGLEFFPDRSTLQMAHGTLGARLAGVSEASAIWVIGSKFYYADDHPQVVKRLLLPDPSGASFRSHIESIGHADTAENVKAATRMARLKGAKVRWYEPFVFQSIILADADKADGWVHIEIVLPYSKPDKRPSITVTRRQSEQTVQEMRRIFQEIWDASKEAPTD